MRFVEDIVNILIGVHSRRENTVCLRFKCVVCSILLCTRESSFLSLLQHCNNCTAVFIETRMSLALSIPHISSRASGSDLDLRESKLMRLLRP